MLLFRVSQRLHPLPYRGLRAMAFFALALAAAVAGQTLAPRGTLAGLALKAVVFLATAGASVAMGIWWTRGSVRESPGPASH
jgi:hypothetical protein